MKPTEMFDDAPVSTWKLGDLPRVAKRYTDHVWIDPLWKKKLWGIVATHKQGGDSRCSLRKLIEAALAEKYGALTEPEE